LVFDDIFFFNTFHGFKPQRRYQEQNKTQNAVAAAAKTNEKNKGQSAGLFAVKT